LVVEDSPLIQRLVSVCLRDTGRSLVSAADGPSAIEAALGDPPELMILDIGLPGCDGWEVLDRVRSNPATSSMPVLVLTAHAQEEYRIRADRQGADGFMTKPFEPTTLRDEVVRILESAGRSAAAG
jgi:CheY-like chemotaxis protein